MSGSVPYNGCINWQAYDTNAIWQMLKDEDAASGYAGVVSWQSLESHLQVSEERLRAAREALATAWPPEQNASGQAFLQQLDRTLASIGETRMAAAGIKVGLEGLVGGLAELSSEVRTQVAHRMDASDNFAPRWWDHAEDEIDAQVRQTMARKEQTFADYATKIQAPAPYLLELVVEDPAPQKPGGNESPTPPSGGVRLAGGHAAPVPVPVPHDPPAPRPGHDPFAPTSVAGPIAGQTLGGGTVLQGTRTPSGQPAGEGRGPGRPGSDGGDAFVPGLTVGVMGTSALTPLFDRPGGGPLAGGPVRPVGMRSGLPSGLVIGEAGIGRSTASGSAVGGSSGTAAGRPVTPGVIGGQPGGAAGAAGRGNTMVPGMAAGGRGRPGEHEDPVERDPDNPWGVDEGVVPVIGPDTSTVVHDPGPGVIGWDR